MEAFVKLSSYLVIRVNIHNKQRKIGQKKEYWQVFCKYYSQAHLPPALENSPNLMPKT